MRILLVLLALALNHSVYAQTLVEHQLQVRIAPQTHRIDVVDHIRVPESLRKNGTTFLLLHAGMQPKARQKGVRLKAMTAAETQQQFGQALRHAAVPLQAYRINGIQSQEIILHYGGDIYHPIKSISEEYARSFRVSPGLIDEKGVFLAGESYWYPHFNAPYVSFRMDVSLPDGWRSVSQGQQLHKGQDACSTSCWRIAQPQDEIFLIAAKFAFYQQTAGAVNTMVFLRRPDPPLAKKYLHTTAQYLDMYGKLIGPYPYSKFALVENFWDTGYGMPSFTLLGPKIIRYPFILHSSYPHEILHNWWGNGVFVRYEQGNWSEGLTSYLADHLVKEQRGRAWLYRRTLLQQYADHVRSNKDFPLTAFRSRHSAATQAVGYGKALMLFHMLRLQLGDQSFRRALQQFYRNYKFKFASFTDIRDTFAASSGTNIDGFFEQWVNRTGAPALIINHALGKPVGNTFELQAELAQTQTAPHYALHIPLAVTLENTQQAFQTTVSMTGRTQKLNLTLPARPLRIDVDPEFDVFRRVHRNEIPPALSQLFGAEQVLIVLPKNASPSLAAHYRQSARQWQGSQTGKIAIVFDDQLTALPEDKAIWLFGWNNRLIAQLKQSLRSYDVQWNGESVTVDKTTLSRNRHAVVLVARQAKNRDMAIGWMASDNAEAIAGLTRKLPHYGRYSYLGFEGDRPDNIAKGQWPVVDSPMSVRVKQADNHTSPMASTAELANRQALANLAPVFSQSRMLEDITKLADPRMAGRELGSPQLDQAAGYIASKFKQMGLQSGGDKPGSYLQSWRADVGKPKGTIALANVIGVIPGTVPAFKKQSVIVSAHYDHLGKGWPTSRVKSQGQIHPGADDNASGVAVMLELARLLAKTPSPRSIVFIAFTGEEAGLLGSAYYVNNAGDYPVDHVIGVLNLDTVGRLGKKKLTVLGTGSAREWVHIFRGAGFVTGISIQTVADEFGSSDQRSFLNAGVPGVQLFTGANADFHRPSDTVDKIDAAGLVKVASVLKEAVVYLASRDQPLNSKLAQTNRQTPTAGGGRRVSLGTIPDFTFQGDGVRMTGVTPSSPAQQAGLRDGDIIRKINQRTIKDLRGFSDVLKTFSAGDNIQIEFTRKGKIQTTRATLISR